MTNRAQVFDSLMAFPQYNHAFWFESHLRLMCFYSLRGIFDVLLVEGEHWSK